MMKLNKWREKLIDRNVTKIQTIKAHFMKEKGNERAVIFKHEEISNQYDHKSQQVYLLAFMTCTNDNYPFIEIKNSSLFRVPFILLRRNSIASTEFISAMNLRRIHTR